MIVNELTLNCVWLKLLEIMIVSWEANRLNKPLLLRLLHIFPFKLDPK